MSLDLMQARKVVKRALAEDIGAGDITTRLTVPASATASGVIVAKEAGIIAGLPIAALCFELIDPTVAFRAMVSEGHAARPGETIAEIAGSAQPILSAERVALNFLQRMSGIATMTAKFVKAVEGTRARIVDTRKTTPGLRLFEKYAVRMGGGSNHRFGLDDGILIKDNHIAIAGGVGPAVRAARRGAPHTLGVEVEVRSISEIEEALASGADAVLLDNMSLEEMREAAQLIAGRALVEASGGVDADVVLAVAATGVDIISVGRLTHSFKSLDLSLQMAPARAAEPA
ncbi:MAG: carboxylating nicotinate-nucleotide diphosphorylase [Armatimonadota bacterium]|nr:carboxylating nicotinate-nucleotide diphosphorylase [Armatimonadota bacterium]